MRRAFVHLIFLAVVVGGGLAIGVVTRPDS
jgi:hypothetical protein